MKSTFTPEQSALVAKIWVSGGSIKPYLTQLGNRPYSTVVSHALYALNLGPRPKSDRGLKEYAWGEIEKELKRGPGTVPEIAARIGFTWSTVNKRLCPANAGESGIVHIIDWRRRSNGGKPVPVYAIGPGTNAPIPAPLTASEKCRRARAIKKSKQNPWAAAIGQIKAPEGAKGTVYKHLVDYEQDELEEA
ncbi:hypothetical protein [Burkholderia territorii]|uniref:hypothetical protein n=1 Tax=Burkholderia territorii TaxID=1503055 RepID=UPI000B26EAC7|nr:hypothetical protein [Burkholderia territorii]